MNLYQRRNSSGVLSPTTAGNNMYGNSNYSMYTQEQCSTPPHPNHHMMPDGYNLRRSTSSLSTSSSSSSIYNSPPPSNNMHGNSNHSVYPQQQHSPPPTANHRVMPENECSKLCSPSSSNSVSPPNSSRWLSHFVILLFSIMPMFYYKFSYDELNTELQGSLAETSNLNRRLDQLSHENDNHGEKYHRLEEQLDWANHELMSTKQSKGDLEMERNALSQKLANKDDVVECTQQLMKKSGVSEDGVGLGEGLMIVKNDRGLMELEDKESRMKRELKEMVMGDKVTALKEYIQNESRREVLDRWGPGPHQIRIDLEFPEDNALPQHSKPPPPYLTIELAPLAMMPHSTHLFLEQVSHKLWEGCSFPLKTDHVIQATTLSGDENNPIKDNIASFENARLDKLAFQEYHHLYPHDQYTVGFSGRPGGEHFYVNMINNTIAHGPGGQNQQHVVEKEADPCFAKVVDGFNTLNIMSRRRTNGAAYEERILIKRTTIISAN